MKSSVANPVQADAAWPEDAIEVGRVLDAYGIKGWLKIQPFSSDPKALLTARQWFLLPPESTVPGTRLARRTLQVLQSREQGDWVIGGVEGIVDRTVAEGLRGSRVFVSRANFPKAAKDEFYWVDLVGLEVVNRDGAVLGNVVGLIDTGPHSVLRVVLPRVDGVAAVADIEPAPAGGESKTESDAEVERLIPFVGAYVDAVSLEERRITVDWGLDY